MHLQSIEKRRAALAVSQKELCLRAGVHATTYSRAKAGGHMPNTRTLEKLATALTAIETEQRESAA